MWKDSVTREQQKNIKSLEKVVKEADKDKKQSSIRPG